MSKISIYTYKKFITEGMAGCFFVDNYSGDILTKIVKFQSKLWLIKHKINDEVKYNRNPLFANFNHCGLWYFSEEIIINHMTTNGNILKTIMEYFLELEHKEFSGKVMFFGINYPELYNHLLSLKQEELYYSYTQAFICGITSLVRDPRKIKDSFFLSPQEVHYLFLNSCLQIGGKCLQIIIHKGNIESMSAIDIPIIKK